MEVGRSCYQKTRLEMDIKRHLVATTRWKEEPRPSTTSLAGRIPEEMGADGDGSLHVAGDFKDCWRRASFDYGCSWAYIVILCFDRRNM